MAVDTVIPTRNAPRALYVASILAALLVSLLGAWFVSGWHDLRRRQHEVRQAPRVAAVQRASDLARELHAELEALAAREVRRPYFHYQNLIHDPRASAGLNVTPSPLARGSEEQFVLGYFQLDAKGQVTTPPINDAVPELSDVDRLAAHRAFRDHVRRDLSRQLAPPVAAAPAGRAVARGTPAPGPRSPRPQPRPDADPYSQTRQTQVVEVDRNVYAQNANPNAVYSQQVQIPKGRVNLQQMVPLAPRPEPARTPPPVTITISPLEWRTLPFSGVPTLLALRHVQTPDGALAQGFVVDRSMLTRWLAAKAGGMAAKLHPDDSGGAVIAPGWGLSVAPDPQTVERAADDAAALARTFLIRFVGIGSLAALAAGSVLLLVIRAENLARERSQFAAAAAHELRTPLAGIQLYGDMLADGLGDPGKIREYARRMSEDASRLGRVVSNMLGFSQLERGSLNVNAQIGSLGQALHDLAERAQPALNRAGAALEIDVTPDLRARFDRDALAQIVGNLLDNAEKYTRGADDRTIRVAARRLGDLVEVSVEDHGPGISDRSTLFRAFSRGVSSSGSPAGLGLGLVLSISLARAMGGELIYKPREGAGGATFVLQLPPA
jgi:signal transduction histidine kinase